MGTDEEYRAEGSAASGGFYGRKTLEELLVVFGGKAAEKRENHLHGILFGRRRGGRLSGFVAMGEPLVGFQVAGAEKPATHFAMNHFCHTKAVASRSR